MTHELKKEWIKPELKVINFAETNETVLLVSVQQTQQQKADSYDPSTQKK